MYQMRTSSSDFSFLSRSVSSSAPKERKFLRSSPSTIVSPKPPLTIVMFAWLKLYFFSQQIIFLSHNKSANSTFSHGLSAKWTGQCLISFPIGSGDVKFTGKRGQGRSYYLYDWATCWFTSSFGFALPPRFSLRLEILSNFFTLLHKDGGKLVLSFLSS